MQWAWPLIDIDPLPDHAASPLRMRRMVTSAHVLPPSNKPTKAAKHRWIHKTVGQFEHLMGHCVCPSGTCLSIGHRRRGLEAFLNVTTTKMTPA